MAEVTETTTTTVNDGNSGMSRAQFVQEEKAKQLDKGLEYLAQKNAELQYDLNRARAAFNADTHVAVPKEDAAALAAYRDQFPTPKEAKAARENLTGLQEKDELRSYDEQRRAFLEEYGADLPDGFKSLIPTAEELQKRPGGKEVLKDLDFLKAEVERVAGVYGAEKQDKRESTDTPGPSPADVKAGGDKAKTNEGKEAATNFYASRFPTLTKEN